MEQIFIWHQHNKFWIGKVDFQLRKNVFKTHALKTMFFIINKTIVLVYSYSCKKFLSSISQLSNLNPIILKAKLNQKCYSHQLPFSAQICITVALPDLERVPFAKKDNITLRLATLYL